jgi:hypothetical protein
MKKKKKEKKIEMQELTEAIDRLIEKYDGEVSFIGNFVAFDKKGDVQEGRIFLYGHNEVVKEQIRHVAEEFIKNKDEEFINI